MGYRVDLKILKRYTNLAALVAILKNRELTLLDPATWKDKNDSYYLKIFKERKGIQTLFAMCFTCAHETSHHWDTFAPGADGVCLKINASSFIQYLNSLDGVIHDKVDYKLIEQVESEGMLVERLPFLKRYPFRDEAEYRIIIQNAVGKSGNIPFDLSWIQEITLSNTLPSGLRKPLVDLLRSIDGCCDLKITRSTLNDNLRWKRASEHAI